MKPLLVGEDNPHSTSPRSALAPLPRGAAGDRLRRILGMTDKEYLRAFDRVNLCTSAWSRVEALWRAEQIVHEYVRHGMPVILLGRKVAIAFGLEFTPFKILERSNILILPHPSGLNRMWDVPGAHLRAVTRQAPG